MKLCLVILVALCVSLGTAEEKETGGWSDVKKPPFLLGDPAVRAIIELEPEIRPILVSKAPKNPKIKDAPITVKAYREQLVDGTNYDVEIEAADLIFATRLFKPFEGKAVLKEVVGPLVLESNQHLLKP